MVREVKIEVIPTGGYVLRFCTDGQIRLDHRIDSMKRIIAHTQIYAESQRTEMYVAIEKFLVGQRADYPF